MRDEGPENEHDARDAPPEPISPETVEITLERSVIEGVVRLQRAPSALLATGLLGGLDVGVGVLAMLVVRHATGDDLLAALAFTIGFMTLTLARSELFTENFLVPVTAVVTGNATVGQVLRLWSGTAMTNLLGGWVLMALVIVALPELGDTAVEVAEPFVDQGVSWRAFASSVLAGAAMTLMTWMERANAELVGRLAAAVMVGFVISATPLLHSIVTSLEHFAALVHGAPWGYRTWLELFVLSVVGNSIGGLSLVTGLRLVQVGGQKLEQERERDRAAEVDQESE